LRDTTQEQRALPGLSFFLKPDFVIIRYTKGQFLRTVSLKGLFVSDDHREIRSSLIPYLALLPYVMGMSISQSIVSLVSYEPVGGASSNLVGIMISFGTALVMLIIFICTVRLKHWNKGLEQKSVYGSIIVLATASLLLDKSIIANVLVTPLLRSLLFFLCLTTACWCSFYWLRQLAHTSRAAAALFAFGSIIIGETLTFLLHLLPLSTRCSVFALLALSQIILIMFIRNQEAISDVLPYASDGFFHFVKVNISNSSFLITIAIGVYCVAIPLGMARAYYENLGFLFTVPFHIIFLALVMILSVVWIALINLGKESAYTTLFWIAAQLILALAIVFYSAFPALPQAGALLTRLGTTFIWAFIWFTTIAFINHGWRNPYYYVTAGWFALVLPQNFGYLIADSTLQISGSHQVILAIMSLLLLVSSQVFFVRLFRTSGNPAPHQLPAKQEQKPLQNFMGLSDEADFSAEHKKTLLEVKLATLGKMFMLTERETEILSLFALGYTQKKVANEVHLSTDTVHTYIKRIYKKTDFHSRNDILDFMQEHL
jgi:DNA-binding CsgD family transcriptional regulator